MSGRARFLDAAATVVDLVARIPDAAWDGPGLGDWDLRALVGHTGRSLITVSTYLAQRAPAVEVHTPEAYYALIARAGSLDTAAVVERGRVAGAALGDDPRSTFRAWRDDAVAVLDATADDAVVPTIGGAMRVADYLPTRVFELAVHGGDIAAATGLSVAFPAGVLADAAALAARVSVELGRGPTVLTALTGRAPLPRGFSIV